MKITSQTDMYKINKEGAIALKTIKNKSIFNIAQKYDKNNNGLLEHNEINEFLQQYKHIEKNSQYSIYYEQKNIEGKLIKKSLLMKADNSQITFMYTDEQPHICILKLQSGEKHILNLKQGKGRYFNNPNHPDVYKQYALSRENLERFIRLGKGKPMDFSNPIEEILYRILNWDW